MHGHDLPNLLGAITVALTLVVILYARGTIREAKRTTAEERKTVTELGKVLAAVGELAASSERALEVARHTAELTAEARDAEQRHRQVRLFRELLGIVEAIQSESMSAASRQLGVDNPDPEPAWTCPEIADLKAALRGVEGIDLPASSMVPVAQGPASVSNAARAAGVELLDVLRGLGVSPRG